MNTFGNLSEGVKKLASNSNNEEKPRLRLAIQKEGRLTDHTLGILRSVNLEFDSYKQRLFSTCRNFDLDILYSRDDDIPEYIASGTVDLGIVGQNLLYEEGVAVEELLPLNFGHCSLVVAVPKESHITELKQLNGIKVATSYPKSAQKFLASQGVRAEIVTLSGAVELAPNLGIAQGIVEQFAGVERPCCYSYHPQESGSFGGKPEIFGTPLQSP
jgi:ATP phosphoribosyltransferase